MLLVATGLPAGATLRDLGEHKLKDFDHPERLFQLVLDGFPADFPPLKTLSSRDAAEPAAIQLAEREVEFASRTLAAVRDLGPMRDLGPSIERSVAEAIRGAGLSDADLESANRGLAMLDQMGLSVKGALVVAGAVLVFAAAVVAALVYLIANAF